MSRPKVILVPTDFGEPSEAALDYAMDLARAFGSEVVLMHAYEIPIVGFPDGAIVATADLTARILEGAQAGLEHQVSTHEDQGVPLRGIIKQGDPYRMVNETAESIGADLIVMGTHGRHGIPRMLLGSVAEKVVRTATIPVLTIHSTDDVKTGAKDREAQTMAIGREAHAPGVSSYDPVHDNPAPSHR